jgi:hypothetical protein
MNWDDTQYSAKHDSAQVQHLTQPNPTESNLTSDVRVYSLN